MSVYQVYKMGFVNVCVLVKSGIILHVFELVNCEVIIIFNSLGRIYSLATSCDIVYYLCQRYQ